MKRKRTSHGGFNARKVYDGVASVNLELDREAVLSFAAALVKAIVGHHGATVTVFKRQKRVTVTTT